MPDRRDEFIKERKYLLLSEEEVRFQYPEERNFLGR